MKPYHTKSAYAASVIRQALSSGTYGAGERLTTARLAKELGLSLTPVREALIELANEGLVEISPHRGARVAELGLTGLADVYKTRAILEAAATEMAVPNLDPISMDALKDVHKQFLHAVKEGDAPALLELNERFHFAIYDVAASPLLSRLIRMVWSSSPNDTFRLIPQRAERSAKDHTAILRALKAGNAQRAANVMRRHIEESLTLITAYKKGGRHGS